MFGLKNSEFYKIIEILKKYSQEIRWVKIFGSRARGDFKNYSDIDLAISFKENTLGSTLDTILELKDRFSESVLPFKVDIVGYEKIANEKLLNYIETEGKIIFLTDEKGELLMTENKLLEKLKDFSKALNKLEKVLEKDPKIDDAYLDATIQRFEFVYELGWKLMKSYLEYDGVAVGSPRETFREAFRIGVVDDATKWIKMMENRNRTSHTYDEETAWEIYGKIKMEYTGMFEALLLVMSEKTSKNSYISHI